MVNKLIFTRFLGRPFWFLDGKLDENDETGDPSFAERLHYLYQRYHEGKLFPPVLSLRPMMDGFRQGRLSSLVLLASPVNAVWWRMVTLGLANLKEDLSPRDPRDNPPYVFGDENRKRQANIAENLADHLLEDSLFQLFLDELAGAEEDTRRRRLIGVLQAGAQYLTAHELALGGQLKVHRLPELKQFDPATGIMFSGRVHQKERKNTPPLVPKPHGRVILVLRPGVYRYDLPNQFVPYDRHISAAELKRDTDSYLVCKAEVMVEAVKASNPSDASQPEPQDEDVWFQRGWG